VYTCDECGFEHDLDEASAAAGVIDEAVGELVSILAGGEQVARRREPERWSPLEYTCHLRDAFLVQRERVLLARRVECPSVVPMGVDERVAHDGYAEQQPADVTRQLVDAAALFTNVLARLGDEDWSRTLIYNSPSPTERSLGWVAVHTAHEAHHHLLDVRRQLTGAPVDGPS
jgi:hypothetical protein